MKIGIGVASVVGVVVAGALVLFSKKSDAAAPATTPVTENPTFINISNGVEAMLNPSAQAPRGIRNNNPLNIRWNALNNWNGQTGKDSGGFSIFDKPENGIRAAGKILDSYARRGISTLYEIVNTWAPAVENNVSAYVDHVSRQTGWPSNKIITRAEYGPLLAAMIKHENGVQPYSMSVINAGLALK